MVKLIQFWNNRSKLFRCGVIWAVVFQIARLVYSYILNDMQTVRLATVSSANTANLGYLTILYLEVLMVVLAIVGLGADIFGKRVKKEVPVKVAEGVWLVKK